MKRTFFLLFAVATLLSLSSNAQDAAKKSKKSKSGDMMMTADLPYQAGYSSSFRMGSHDLSKMVLELYKDYEAQDFQSKESWFSDTVMAFLPDGSMMRGKAQVIEGFKNMRAAEKSSKFTFDAIIPLTSTDRNEDWVALWGTEEFTSESMPNANKMEFQAIWRVNKEKKIDFIKIFQSKPAAQQ
jgi:hypothetical protein